MIHFVKNLETFSAESYEASAADDFISQLVEDGCIANNVVFVIIIIVVISTSLPPPSVWRLEKKNAAAGIFLTSLAPGKTFTGGVSFLPPFLLPS